MTRALISIAASIAITASAAQGQQSSYAHRAWFPDGTGVEIHAEATGSSHISAPLVETGIANDEVNRLIVDKNDHILFGYNLAAFRDTQSDTTVIRILPLDSKTLELLNDPRSRYTGKGGPIPTVSMVHEFRSVKSGEAVTLDVMSNPATGEKVYDVLRPISGPSPTPTGMSVSAAPTPAQLSLKGIELRVNGQLMNAPVSWMIGAAVRIDVPGHGAYVIAAENPKNAHFYQTVRADGKSLNWSIDGDQVQVISKTDVGTSGIIWVYHDVKFKSQDQPDAVRLQTADTVEWLLPKK
jgi:hypothetical protein